MRIGCLGAAGIAPRALCHPAACRGDAVLQAVAARDRARAEAFAHRYGFAEVLDDYAAVVASPDVDLVYNPLPIHLHAEWSIKALRAGKHVLCEKPFAMNMGEARAVLEAAAQSGRRVVEAFHYRHHPAFATLLGWIDGGGVGRVRSVAASFNVAIDDAGGEEIRHRPDTGGGAFMDLGCYPLAWALAIFAAAPVEAAAEAVLTPRGVDESLAARLTFPGGATADLSCSMGLDQPFAASLTVEGTEGRVTFDNPLAPHAGAELTLDRGGARTHARIDRTTTYAHQLFAVLDALTDGSPLPTEGEAILRQQEAIDAVYEAAGLRHLRYR
ncbi:MAG: Gfo/Idh/MocA family oxidoreductase [Caulobacterales bacterium]|nr:Gfo/Idh/MocA family oxidoreductase [Caulobacterales bacterium]